MRKKWEYINSYCTSKNTVKTLNILGEDGWELVHFAELIPIINPRDRHTVRNYRAILKRERQDE